MIARRHLALAALAPLTFALAACGGSDETTGAPTSGEPIASIAAPEGQSWAETAVETPEGGFRIGNPDAPLKLVEYASHTCSHCATFAQDAAGGIEEHVESGRVSYEIRNQIHDGLDLTLAMLARCSGPEGFHPLANQAWANFNEIIATAQQNGAALQQAMQAPGTPNYVNIADAAGLLDFFAARGISRDQATQCLSDPQVAQTIVENSTTQSDELGVTGTPTFFLNGARLDGTSWEAVEAALQQAGAR